MTEKELLKKMGMRIKEIRASKGVSQQQLAIEAFDTDKSNISRLEGGRVNASIYTLHKVAMVLEVSISDLLDFEDTPGKKGKSH